jgi:uncharacterized LabA/DUF88 family protein
MTMAPRNYAFIDSQNLNLSIREQGWSLDFARFRVYLREKYHVEKAYLFLGFVPGNQAMYSALQNYGFILIFKPTMKLPDGKVKGNVDAELVLEAMKEYGAYEKTVVVTGDGDFACLIEYLRSKDKLEVLLVPNQKRYSGLLAKAAGTAIAFMNNLNEKLGFKKK